MRPGPLVVVGVGLLWFVLSGRAAAVAGVLVSSNTALQGAAPTATPTSYTPGAGLPPVPGPVGPPVYSEN